MHKYPVEVLSDYWSSAGQFFSVNTQLFSQPPTFLPLQCRLSVVLGELLDFVDHHFFIYQFTSVPPPTFLALSFVSLSLSLSLSHSHTHFPSVCLPQISPSRSICPQSLAIQLSSSSSSSGSYFKRVRVCVRSYVLHFSGSVWVHLCVVFVGCEGFSM